MKNSHLAFLLEGPDNHVERLASRTYAHIRRDVPAYTQMDAPDLLADVRQLVRYNAKSYFRCLVAGETPGRDVLQIVERTARARLRQNVPLDAVLTSYRIGISEWWRYVMEITDAKEHGALAILTLAYADLINDVVTMAYADERAHRRAARREEIRLLLTEVLRAEHGLRPADFESLKDLGLDPTDSWFVTVVDRRRPDSSRAVAPGGDLHTLNRQLEADFPDIVTVFIETALAVLAPHSRVEQTMARLMAAGLGRSPSNLIAGVGRDYRGLSMVSRSYADARRALALGPVLGHPAPVVFFSDIEVLDLFRTGAPVDDYVRRWLGPLLDKGDRERSRHLDTLRAFFDCGMRRQRAAAALSLHHNTLTQRLTAIEDLLGGHLDDGDFGFRVQLAVRMLPLANETDLGSAAVQRIS